MGSECAWVVLTKGWKTLSEAWEEQNGSECKTLAIDFQSSIPRTHIVQGKSLFPKVVLWPPQCTELELKLKVVVNYPEWVLGTQLWVSQRINSTSLKHWAVSPLCIFPVQSTDTWKKKFTKSQIFVVLVTHACHYSTLKMRQKDWEFKSNLNYVRSLRPA